MTNSIPIDDNRVLYFETMGLDFVITINPDGVHFSCKQHTFFPHNNPDFYRAFANAMKFLADEIEKHPNVVKN